MFWLFWQLVGVIVAIIIICSIIYAIFWAFLSVVGAVGYVGRMLVGLFAALRWLRFRLFPSTHTEKCKLPGCRGMHRSHV